MKKIGKKRWEHKDCTIHQIPAGYVIMDDWLMGFAPPIATVDGLSQAEALIDRMRMSQGFATVSQEAR